MGEKLISNIFSCKSEKCNKVYTIVYKFSFVEFGTCKNKKYVFKMTDDTE